MNKVLFALDDSATGWYVYLLAPLPRLTVMREGESRVGKGRLMSVPVELEDGFVPVGTNVEGPEGLEAVLSHWAEASNTETVGKIGRRGGSPVITVEMGLDKFVLNRDTTRPAVHDFLAAAARAGGAFNLRWHVTRNQRGPINKVSYRPDDAHIPGWFAYLRQPIPEPRALRFTVRRRGPALSMTQPRGAGPHPRGKPGTRVDG